jgi:glycosyltransferase involved in cell wall biosynthesis
MMKALDMQRTVDESEKPDSLTPMGTDCIRSNRPETLPRISIIVNNYNYARFLPDAINSALNQTYPNVEVIVVDDGSSDDSPNVIAGYGNQITAILKENGGQASAFNAGFERSNGEVIMFLDADDRLKEDTAAIIASQFQQDQGLAHVMFRLEVIDENGIPTGILKPDQHLPRRSGDLRRHILSFPFDIPRMATSGNAFAAWALKDIMPVPVSDYPRVNADWYLTYLAPLLGRVSFLDDVGGYYRVHGRNNFELSRPDVNLNQVRQVIVDDQRTAHHIRRLAERKGLLNPDRNTEILSFSYVSNRIVSLKLDPRRHPIEGDDLPAARRRFDVAWPFRIMFMAWIVAAIVAPKRIVRWLAIRIAYPSTRGWLNHLLGKLQRPTPAR